MSPVTSVPVEMLRAVEAPDTLDLGRGLRHL